MVFGVPTARNYVESALRYVGYGRQTTGFFSHSVIAIAGQFMAFIWPKGCAFLVDKAMIAMRDQKIRDGHYKRTK